MPFCPSEISPIEISRHATDSDDTREQLFEDLTHVSAFTVVQAIRQLASLTEQASHVFDTTLRNIHEFAQRTASLEPRINEIADEISRLSCSKTKVGKSSISKYTNVPNVNWRHEERLFCSFLPERRPEQTQTKCGLCLTRDVAVNCLTCGASRCEQCDGKYHKKRHGHQRVPVSQSTLVAREVSADVTEIQAISEDTNQMRFPRYDPLPSIKPCVQPTTHPQSENDPESTPSLYPDMSCLEDDFLTPQDVEMIHHTQVTNATPSTPPEILAPQVDASNAERRRSYDEKIEKVIKGLETLRFLKVQIKSGTPLREAVIKSSSQILDDESLEDDVTTIKDIFYAKVNRDMAKGVRLSEREALEALRLSPGDHIRAATVALNARTIKCQQLGVDQFGHDSCHEALFHSGGDVHEARVELQQGLLHDLKEHFTCNGDGNTDLEDPQPNSPYSLPAKTKTDELIERTIKQSNFSTPEEQERATRIVMCEKNLDYAPSLMLPSLLRTTEFRYVTCLVAATENPADCTSYIKECSVCTEDFPMSHMVQLPNCRPDCNVCCGCVSQQLKVNLDDHSRNVLGIGCPGCDQPIIREDTSPVYAAQIRALLDDDHYSQLERRLFENALKKDPKFKWCAHCEFGFLWDDPRLSMRCDACGKYSCSGCSKQWHETHKGISCEQFDQWQLENDPEYQREKLDAFLRRMDAMQCPACQFRYELSRGGCLHFKCGQCHTEFCGFCYAIYDRSCSRYKGCQQKNLHAHCVRSCFSFLRDWEVRDLQRLLASHKVEFDRNPPSNQSGAQCPISVTNDSGGDGPCGEDVQPDYAGLCEKHYKEYLATLIKRERLDPVSMMDGDRCKLELRSHEIEFNPNLNEQQLRLLVQQKIPMQPVQISSIPFQIFG